DAAQRRRLSALPRREVLFNYLGQLDASFEQDSPWRLSEEPVGACMDEDAPRSHALAINGQIHAGELRLEIGYSAARYRADTIAALAASYQAELEALIAHCSEGAAGVTPSDFPLAGLSQAQLDALPLAAAQLEDLYPLSPMQAGMLFHSLYAPDGSAYLNQIRLDIEGLDAARFREAWQGLQARHDILRTGFLTQRERLLQWVARDVALPFAEHDWRARAGEEDLGAALDELARADLAQGFDLSQPPLQRLHLVRTGPARHHLIWTTHHLLLDGWSTSQLLGEVLRRYAGEALAPHGGRYRDYIAWLAAREGGASEAYWRAQTQRLESPTRLAQPTQPTNGDADAGHGEHERILDASRTRRLLAAARRARITPNTLVQAAWALLLRRHTGQDVVAFGATVAGRPQDLAGAEHLLGLFINTLPVIVEIDPWRRVDDWLQALQAQNLALREHEHTPLYDIQRWAGQAGQGLFDTLLVFENYPVDSALQAATPGGLRIGGVENR
ncbi:condensation domain-containing protein, partial [Nitrosovibrio sp. Nv17]|uniref:condensation domain-containing protein n=1 Tax=Nitrosovibrio sp. Nv17 TaxID=1855339 RepID=UPI0009088547